MSALLVGEVLAAVAVVAAFGYFIYKKVTAPKKPSTGSGGGGGSKSGPGNVNQV